MPEAQKAIDLYLNRTNGRNRGHYKLLEDLEVLLCIRFLCLERGDGTGVHIRRCTQLALLCLNKLDEGLGAAQFADMVSALETYCELQYNYFDDELQICMSRLFLEPELITALNDRQDYQDLLRYGMAHTQQMALLFNRAALLYLPYRGNPRGRGAGLWED